MVTKTTECFYMLWFQIVTIPECTTLTKICEAELIRGI